MQESLREIVGKSHLTQFAFTQELLHFDILVNNLMATPHMVGRLIRTRRKVTNSY